MLFLPYLLFNLFTLQEKFGLVTFAIFSTFADTSKPFLAFSLSTCKGRILLNLLFLLFLPHFYSTFSLSKKNSRYFCDFCEICGLNEALLDLFSLFVSVEFCKMYMYSCYFSKKNSSYFCDICDICYFFYTFRIAVFFKSFS